MRPRGSREAGGLEKGGRWGQRGQARRWGQRGQGSDAPHAHFDRVTLVLH